MKFVDQKNVIQSVKDSSKRDIDAVNAYIDTLKGTVVSIQSISAGQQRSYGDSVYEALIFCHQPNCNTLNAPLTRVIDINAAKAIARIFVCNFDDEPKDWASPKLDFIRPEVNPCGLQDHSVHSNQGLHSCWRVRVTMAYTG